MEISEIRVDLKVVEEGDWVEEIPGLDGVRLRVRGVGNADYRRLDGKMRRRIQARRLDPVREDEALNEGIIELVLKTVLLDWDGLFQGGEPVKYSPERAAEFLKDPAMRQLLNAVIWAGNEVGARRKRDGVEAEKN